MGRKHIFGDTDPFELSDLNSADFPDENKDLTDESAFAQLLHQEQMKQTDPFQALKRGQRVEARVISLSENLIYFDVGHRSEGYAEKDFFSPEELSQMTPGMIVPLYIASVENGIELVKSLSAQQASFDMLRTAFENQIPVMGKVVGENKGGLVVELPGAKGFVPFSQMEFGQSKPSNEYLGKTYEFLITRFQGREVVLNRASLQREIVESERQKLLNELSEGQQKLCKVTKVEEFGAFVDLGSGVTALIPISEIGWSRSANVHDVLKIGDSVTIKIIKIDRSGSKLKIAASMKQLEGDPWDIAADHLAVGQTVEGTVTRLMPFGAFVEINPGLEGLVHISEMSSKRRIIQPAEVVTIGKKVPVRIVSIDRTKKRLSLSMKAQEDDILDCETREKFLRNEEDDHRGVEFVDSAKGSDSALSNAFAKAKKK